jgi:uncharacterized membrane-anchored protein YhcB (DUF1043 family)
MWRKKIPLSKTAYVLFVATGVIFMSCQSGDTGNQSDIEISQSELQQDLEDLKNDLTHTKKIFYSLPSPLETAMLLKSAGATYQEDLLNRIENAPKYTTNKKMALNLGIYTTDLSFASLFDQTQTSIEYMSAAKELADRLGILDVFTDSTIKRLEDNVNNRDVIMDIISETFMSSSSYLTESNRAPIAAIVLIGGWIEGLYISTAIVKQTSFENNKLVERIADQKFSLDIVIKLIEKYSYNEDVASLLITMSEVQDIYDKIEIKTTQITPVKDEKTNVTVLESSSTISMSPEVFEELSEKVKIIRTNFIQ